MSRRHYTPERLINGEQYYTLVDKTPREIHLAIIADERLVSFVTGEYIEMSDCRWWLGPILNKGNCEAAMLRDELEILELESGQLRNRETR